jgi:hypothetical protein
MDVWSALLSIRWRPARITSVVKDDLWCKRMQKKKPNNNEMVVVGRGVKSENVEDEPKHVIMFFVFVGVADLLVSSVYG